MRIRISAVRAAAGPGMAASVDEPLLNDHRAGLVPGPVRVWARVACRASARSTLSLLLSASTTLVAFDGCTM